MIGLLLRAALLVAWLSISAAMAGEPAQVLAPGYGALQYEPPAAGSYQLPPLGTAVDGRVIDDSGKPLTLYELLGDKFVLLGFIYTHCSDVNGCPLATFVMKKVQDRLHQDAELGPQLRLISLSFDPELDTPQVLRDYAGHFRREGADWQFLTTASDAQLQPILDGFDQWRQKSYDENDKYNGSMSHVLRVYLIDKQHRIRNIYSTGFLDADTVINDLLTLEMESSAGD